LISLVLEGGRYGTALQAASYSGHQQIVQQLIWTGAQVNVQGENNFQLRRSVNRLPEGGKYGTALQAASAQGHLEIVHLLVTNDAGLNNEGMSFRL
jgi:ankyrin repeat protein